MRINKFVAQATGLSRRAADRAVQEGRVAVNNRPAGVGDTVTDGSAVTLDSQPIALARSLTIMLNKPASYVCSRARQGNSTVYDLLPPEYHKLKPVGRLDKDSSGLLLLTNDGDLANQLAHPRYAKTKIYEITLDKPLTEVDKAKIERGVKVDDYVSQLRLSAINNLGLKTDTRTLLGIETLSWRVTMSQGHNRQIRRTFAALDYQVKILHRIRFGAYSLAALPAGQYRELTEQL
jgi:23S rRNA pseudouridine2605 synthase